MDQKQQQPRQEPQQPNGNNGLSYLFIGFIIIVIVTQLYDSIHIIRHMSPHLIEANLYMLKNVAITLAFLGSIYLVTRPELSRAINSIIRMATTPRINKQEIKELRELIQKNSEPIEALLDELKKGFGIDLDLVIIPERYSQMSEKWKKELSKYTDTISHCIMRCPIKQKVTSSSGTFEHTYDATQLLDYMVTIDNNNQNSANQRRKYLDPNTGLEMTRQAMLTSLKTPNTTMQTNIVAFLMTLLTEAAKINSSSNSCSTSNACSSSNLSSAQPPATLTTITSSEQQKLCPENKH